MIDYAEFSRQYYEDAERVKAAIERQRELLKEAKGQEKDQIKQMIQAYGSIYRELINAGNILRKRSKSESKTNQSV